MVGKKKIVIAGIWVTVVFGLSQIIRLGSNLVLTRMLAPEIFGVMAVVLTVITGMVMLTDLGLWPYIIRHKEPENKHVLNVVWTLQVLRSWLLFFVVAIGAVALHYANAFYPDSFSGVYANPLLPLLVVVASVGVLFDGHTSLASPIMSRKMEVGKIELIELAAQLISLALMITWVWIYPTIWALIAGGLMATIVIFVFNYLFFPYRHKLAWDKTIALDVYHYSKWIVISSTLTYLFAHGDRLFFAAKIAPAMLGVYTIAVMMSGVITTVVETLAAKIVFPALSSVVHSNRDALKEKYYKVRLLSDSAVFFIVGGLFATSQLVIDVLYDDRYIEAGWMLQVLSVSVIGNTLTVVSVECLAALSITKIRMWVMLIRAIGLIVGLPLAFKYWGLHEALWVIAINVFLPLPVVYWTLHKHNVFSLLKEIRCLPLVGAGYLVGLLVVHLYQTFV